MVPIEFDLTPSGTIMAAADAASVITWLGSFAIVDPKPDWLHGRGGR